MNFVAIFTPETCWFFSHSLQRIRFVTILGHRADKDWGWFQKKILGVRTIKVLGHFPLYRFKVVCICGLFFQPAWCCIKCTASVVSRSTPTLVWFQQPLLLMCCNEEFFLNLLCWPFKMEYKQTDSLVDKKRRGRTGKKEELWLEKVLNNKD